MELGRQNLHSRCFKTEMVLRLNLSLEMCRNRFMMY